MLGTKTLLDKSRNVTVTKDFLIDPQGRTLYTYAKDSKSPSTLPTNCTGNCATDWPVFFNSSVNVPTSSKLKSSDFGTITRTDGAGGTTHKQLTYKGMPLYYCASDNQTPGKTEGHNLTTNGDLWVVAEL
jgi:predicted lipoprotein with Yx(FWY)xxD motif